MAVISNVLGILYRRIIFIPIALSMITPLLLNLIFPNPVGAEPSRDMYEYIDALPEGSDVLMSFDYDSSTMPELHPMAIAIVTHLMRKDINIVCMALWPDGASLAQEVMSGVADSLGKVQYEDWCNLGYKTGGGSLIVHLGSSMNAVFPADRDNLPWEDIPMLEHISDLTDFDIVITLSAGDPGVPSWVMVARDRFGVPVAGGCTALMAAQFYTYLHTGQMVGLLDGFSGAANYENLVGIVDGD